MSLMNYDFHTAPAPAAGHIGKLLLDSGKLTPLEAEKALQLQKEQNLRFGEAAIQLGFITEQDIQQALAQQFSYPFLAEGDAGLDPRLIAAYQPFDTKVEALRSLRSQLMLRWLNDTRRSVVLTGYEAGAGTSLTAANLAIVFSQLGERTLLVDSNLRQPQQHTLFGLPNRAGLSDLLAGRCGTEAIVRVDKLRDLSVLPAGNPAPNPQELLSRESFAELLYQLAQAYDVILLDSHPMQQVADAQLVAARAGAALIVGRQHRSPVKGLQSVRDQLQVAGATVLGCVLTMEH